MRKILFGIAAAVLAGTPALAADLAPVAPGPMYYKAPPMAMAPQTWTGFYIGGDIGGAWSHTDGSWAGLPGVNPTSGNLNGSGFLGGVHAGYNYQFAPSWVLGVEGDWDWAHAGGSNSQTWTLLGTGVPIPGAVTTMNATVDWLASIRGRLGYLVTPRVLAYVTGGAAWGNVHYSATAADPATGYLASTAFNNTSDGFVVGGGLEWAMTTHWSVRAEYLYYRLDSGQGATAAGTPAAFAGLPSSFSWGHTSVDVARAGLSYKF
ncbi:MAG: outer membrane protein [Xanthobacteraceae bacterium]